MAWPSGTPGRPGREDVVQGAIRERETDHCHGAQGASRRRLAAQRSAGLESSPQIRRCDLLSLARVVMPQTMDKVDAGLRLETIELALA